MFSKTLPRIDLFDNTVFLFSCGRVTTELFEMLTSQHLFAIYQRMRSVLWGSCKGNLLICFLLSKFECQISISNMAFRLSNVEFRMSQRFLVDGDIFENGSR